MYSRTELALKYLKHHWHASNGKGHGIHSPFVFEFVTEVLNDPRSFYPYTAIEKVRSGMLRDQRMIGIKDYGKPAGTKGEIKIADIAHRSLSGRKFGHLLFRIVNYYRPRNIMEMGTSLGISGAYLAAADGSARLTTLEGSPSIARIAAENFSRLNLQNIIQVTGNFEDTLSAVMESSPPFDLVFIDGNHRKDPVLKYFRQLMDKKPAEAVFIFHDIHWSRGMEEAWRIIREHPEVMLSIDLFSAGFIFFRENFRVKQHFNIRF